MSYIEGDAWMGVAEDLFAEFDKKKDFGKVWEGVPITPSDEFGKLSQKEQIMTKRFVRSFVQNSYDFKSHPQFDDLEEAGGDLLNKLKIWKSESADLQPTKRKIIESLDARVVGYCALLEIEDWEYALKYNRSATSMTNAKRAVNYWKKIFKVSCAAEELEKMRG